ncbi:MAG: N-acetylmuramoyl-L-alanine amidase [Gammaproteobacteria bacterium]
MIKKVFGEGMLRKAWVAVAMAVLPAMGFAAPGTTLNKVSIASGEGGVRVTLETSAPTRNTFFTLERPNRIVIDLRDTRLAKGTRMPAGIGTVNTVRTGPRPSDTLRVVIELRSAAASRGQWQPAFADVGDQYIVAIGSKAFVAATFAKDAPAPKVASAKDALEPKAVAAKDAFELKTAAAKDVSELKAVAARDASETKVASAKVMSEPKRSARKSPVPQSAGNTTVATSIAIAAESITPKTVRATHAPADGDRDIIVAVDAGHGGQDPGAIGRNGTMEKNVVLAIARALANRIDTEPGMRAYLTRDDDYFVVLRDRMVRARNAKADIFVSVHADSIRDRNITGASVYVLSDHGASSEAARWLAERENAADLKGGVKLDDKDRSLASVLLDLSQTANLGASMTAAERVLQSLDDSVNVRKTKVQQAGLMVLKSPDIPSMLVETAYISNPGEEARLKSIAHQAKIAEAIFAGVRGYFERNPPPGTRFAQLRRSQLASLPSLPATP